MVDNHFLYSIARPLQRNVLAIGRAGLAALAGDKLVTPSGKRPYDDRLDHAALRNRRGEFVERRLVEARAWLARQWFDRGHRQR